MSHSWSQTITLGSLSIMGWAVGLNISLTPNPQQAFLEIHSPAQAQAVTQKEIRDYSKSVLAIEQLRNDAYQNIKGKVSPDVLRNITCDQRNTRLKLRRPMRAIVDQYCAGSVDIVESNGLTIQRFNTITDMHQTNPDLQKRIKDTLLQLQQ